MLGKCLTIGFTCVLAASIAVQNGSTQSRMARDKELDNLFERLYEDNVSGKIDDTRFSKMSKRYEEEQGENAGKIKLLKAELKKAGAGQVGHIDVYHAEKDGNGLTTQRVDIHYNCIGVFAVPDRKNFPEVDVLMETRKGVAVSHSPARIA